MGPFRWPSRQPEERLIRMSKFNVAYRIGALAAAVALSAAALGAGIAHAQANQSPGGVPSTDSNVYTFPYTYNTNRMWAQGSLYGSAGSEATTATGGTGYVFCAGGGVELQLDGTATSLSGQLQRSGLNPIDTNAHWAPVGSAQSASNISTGLAPVTATENGIGWYRYNITAVSGGYVNVSITCPTK
jgi:hypothetical protein